MSDTIKVLYVEDEAEIRENMIGILESEGFEVYSAANGKEGLEKFLETHPDIVISDIMMHEANGYELLKSIREIKDSDNSNVPFILLSALGQKDDIITGINLSASDYLVKPVDFDLLIAKIREKTGSSKKAKEVQEKNIKNLKQQVSNILPEEMLQYVDMINQISSVLKTEIYGPLPHKKYLDDINKIYIHSLKLKTLVSNFLSGNSISSQLDVKDEISDPVVILHNFVSSVNEKFQHKIKINDSNHDIIPNIKINKTVLTEVVKRICACILKSGNDVSIQISLATDHLDRLMFIFYPDKTLNTEELDGNIEKAIDRNTLDSQGLILENFAKQDNINLVLSIPNYRVVKKR